MVTFKAEVERFERMGEKTGWTYIAVPHAIAHQVKPDCRKSFRVKGKFDQIEVEGLATVPMGEGNFIIALKSSLRKLLKKEEGAILDVQLEEDLTFKVEMPEEMEICLHDEPHLLNYFLSLSKSSQHYFINWYASAKTEKTKVKRLTMLINAMDQQLDFAEMIRAEKGK